MRTAGIIAAAGRGTRFGSEVPKQFVKVNGKEILAYAALLFEKCPAIEGYVITVAPEFRAFTEKNIVKKYKLKKVLGIADGGSERFISVRNSLSYLKDHKPKNVLIHDGARPYFDKGLPERIVAALKKYPAAIPVKKINQTVKVIKNGLIEKTIDRELLRTSETPQGYRFNELLKLYSGNKIEKLKPTDEAAMFEVFGLRVAAIEDKGFNIKITAKQDIETFRSFLRSNKK